MKLPKKLLGCCSCGCLAILLGSCGLLAGTPMAIRFVRSEYEQGRADWAEPLVRELKYWEESWGDIWDEGFDDPPPPPCTANHCRNYEAIAESDSILYAVHFPFLRGEITNFYSWEVDGFQDGWDFYRFDVSPANMEQILQASYLEQHDDCGDDFLRDAVRDWWQPEALPDKTCYSGHSAPTYANRYQLIYSSKRQTAYFYVYKP